MKKTVLAIITALILAISLISCTSQRVKIEDYEWKLETAMFSDGTSLDVIAVSESNPAYPEAPVVDVTLVAANGKLTVTDNTNKKTYEGTYTVSNRTPEGTDYKITLNGKSGYATVAMTTYADGSQTPTLPINLGDRSLAFYAK